MVQEVVLTAGRFRRHLAVYHVGAGVPAVAVDDAIVPLRELTVMFAVSHRQVEEILKDNVAYFAEVVSAAT